MHTARYALRGSPWRHPALLELEHLGSDLEVAVLVENRHPAFSRRDCGPQISDAYCSMMAGRAGGALDVERGCQ
jgi:hypothetical protein